MGAQGPIIAPWVAGQSPDGGTVLINVITGACVCLFSLTAGGRNSFRGPSACRAARGPHRAGTARSPAPPCAGWRTTGVRDRA
ncbi:SPW repeat protein [Streptomyces sp. NPDC058700]|uniref:SPW repeat domain-containing protein n=1 Tax=unclassified Streptomyces TaxID=2593676 RepID=UPI00364AB8A4